MAKVYPRGSEWRKWDLHFHTPSSYDYEDKSVTDEQTVATLINNGISVVAITDHHIMDVARINNLRQIAEDKLTILPGIEFLSDARGDKPIHFVGIFSEEADLALIWGQLENNTNLIKIRRDKAQINEVYCDLVDTAKLVKKLGGIVTIHAGRKNNGLEEITNSLPHGMAQKRDISDCVDIFEMGKDKDLIEYQQYVFPSIRRVVPMIMGSDNHNVNNYSLKQNCWIKADPTFEGLKQIMFEPQDRVRLADVKPEEKTGYHVIDAVILKGKNFHKDCELYLNPNLNTIIGGRSTGKSTLLKCIAREINPALSIGDTFINDNANSLSLRWQDQETALPRDIEYFEQSYMHTIAKEPKKLDALIENIIENKDEGKLLSAFRAFRDNNKSEIIQKVNALFRMRQQLDLLMQSIREKGESKGVKLEIQALGKRIAEIKSHTTLNSDELQKFENDTQANIRHKESVNIIDKDVESLTLLSQKELFNRSFIYEFSSLSDGVSSAVRTIYDTITGETKKEWAKQINERIEALNKEKESLLSQSKAIEESPLYKKGVEDINNNIVYKELQGKLDAERQKLTDIEATEKKLRATSDQVQELKKEIIALHCLYNTKTDELIAGLVISHEGLEIKSRKHYKKSELSSFLEGRLNQRGYARQENVANIVEKYPSDIEKVTGDFVDKNLMGQVEYKSGNVSENVVSELLSTNWFDISFELTYQNDVFTDMSQGKQAFVVLKLLLEFSDKKCPILIDQPEDSLDNRAIYSELVEYLKSKKKERQIILVTHNSNVVVSADAEQVIVANQHGKDSLNKDGVRFQYSCGSLENTYPKRELTPHIVLDSQGIREHVCEILEGGHLAFRKREEKYGFRQA